MHGEQTGMDAVERRMRMNVQAARRDAEKGAEKKALRERKALS